ncbi:TcfC/CooC/PapC-like putative outer membrane usher protein in CS1 pili formation [Vibrio crassostreae]|uniref:TcfC E-set like domain-containing protein n=1 Tax=Vibrio crassostreae TaxID=246167 RepID=UPI001043F265|nr:TcfC E-set like domain-containing protein [Vibrio crassostreae]TCN88487.1 TcfC/CooC/PapC-like putative outer membrane usher protein in CS1 pili formation [Vibrio crassostreae]
MKIWLVLFSLIPLIANAKYIPKDFEFLYEKQELIIRVELPNDLSQDLNVVANYDGIIDFVDVEAFKVNLRDSGIKEDIINDVITKIERKDCEELYCRDINIDYSYDLRKLSVEVPSTLLDENFDKEPYTKRVPKRNGIISNNTVNASYYTDSFNSTFSNETIFGFGRGFIDSSFSLRSQNNDYELEKFYYYHNFSGFRLNSGYTKYAGQVNDNASGMLDFTTASNRLFASFGSSSNLLKMDKSEYKRIYFDMKSNGIVKFLRDGKTIKSNYYSQGQNYVTYSELPRGNYDLVLMIKPENGIEEILIKRVNNNASDLSLNNTDFNLSFNNIELSDEDFDDEKLIFLEGSLVKRFESNLMLGTSLRTSNVGTELGGYAGIEYNSYFISSYFSTSNNSDFFDYSLGIGRFSINYQELNLYDDFDFMAALYGVENYHQWSMSYGFPLFDGNVNFYINDMVRQNVKNTGRQFENVSSSLSYNRIILDRVTLTLSLGYNKNSNVDQITLNNNDYDDTSIGIRLDIPLSNDIKFSSDFFQSKNAGQKLVNTVSANSIYNDENMNLNGSLSSNLNGEDSSYRFSTDYIQKNEKYKSDGYLTYDTNGDRLANFNASTTFVSDWGDSYLTSNNNSNSYIIVTNDNSQDINKKNEIGQMSIKSNTTTYSYPLYTGATVLPIKEYNSYRYSVDNEVAGFISSNKLQGTSFSYPGTLNVINNDVKKVISFMTYFENFNKESLNNIECVGDGCVDVSRIGDGIYSITVVENDSYKIVSNGQHCLVNKNDLQYYNGRSRCFPKVVEDDNSGLQIVEVGIDNNKDTYAYLGKLTRPIPERLKRKLNDLGIDIIKYEFGENKEFLFVRFLDNPSNLDLYVDNEVWSEIESYAVTDYELEGYSYVY